MKHIQAGLIAAVLSLLAVPGLATDIMVSTDPMQAPGMTRYNFRVGNLRLGMTGTISAEWSDNINYSDAEDEEKSSWSYVPQLTLDAFWPVSPHVQFSSGIGVGYRYYSEETGENDWYVRGGEGALSAEIIAG